MSKRPPNILFFFPDQHRPDWVGWNPDMPLRTPNLAWLRESGVTFTQCYTPSPLCAPARACVASGMDYAHCRVPSNRENYPLDMPTYYQRLRDAGYRVGGVGKFDLHKDLERPKADLDWGLDGSRLLDEWGFTEGIDNEGKLDGSGSYRGAGRPKGPYLNYLHERGLADAYVKEHDDSKEHRGAYVTVLSDDDYCDNWLSENGLQILQDFPVDQPWHLVINFVGPHDPMDVTQAMHDAWTDITFPPPVDNHQAEYSQADHQRNRQHYAAMIENIDHQVGRFLDLVRQRGELDNTIVVYASDHGEMLGDHSRWGKSTWQTPSTGVPLIVAGPGIQSGVTSDALVSLHDLAATFLELADAPELPGMDARSLLPVLSGETKTHHPVLISALADWQVAYDGQYKIVVGLEPDPMLFDLNADPHELVNIAAQEPAIVDRLLASLTT